MKVNKISNQTFSAKLLGDYKDIIKMAVDNGFTNKGIKSALSKIQKACPSENDKVYLYHKKVYRFDNYGFENMGIRSGVKVFKDGKTLELNVDPRTISSKYLLSLMALKVEQLASGKIKPDEMIKIF